MSCHHFVCESIDQAVFRCFYESIDQAVGCVIKQQGNLFVWMCELWQYTDMVFLNILIGHT